MNNKILSKALGCWKAALTAVFAVSVYLFWSVRYISVMSYHEQLQLFLSDTEYFRERVSVPGGLCDYVAEFLTQFYCLPVAGPLVIVMVLAAVQLMTWRLSRLHGADGRLYPLSFGPVLLLWFYMENPNVMLSFAVALLAALCSSWLYMRLRGSVVRWAYSVVVTPLFYWFFGPAVFVCVIIDLIYDCRRSGGSVSAWLLPVVRAVLAVTAVLCSQYVVQYPLPRLFAGINYFRFPYYESPHLVPPMQFAVMAVTAVWPALTGMWRRRVPNPVLSAAAVAAAGCVMLFCGIDTATGEIIEYDYLTRTSQWDRLIEKADRRPPSAPMSVACLNLALYEKGRLSNDMFAYYQHGSEGLLPPFGKDFISILATAEIYFRLGMVNTAQRYYFEAQEAIPNHRKSVRMTRRLAETNLVNGQYRVAAKYLRMLDKTLFYSRWAGKTRACLYNEDKINADPVYGWIRSCRYRRDFLFSEEDLDQLLGMLYVRNTKNKMAFEYLMAYELLQKELKKFTDYYPLGKYADYARIPTSYQEALVYIWTRDHRSFSGMPWSIEESTLSNMSDFIRRYMSDRRDPAIDTGLLGRSYWRYLMKGGTTKN